MSARRLDRAVDAVEEPVEADLLVRLHVGLADADVDGLDAADADGGVLHAAQPVQEDLRPLPEREPLAGASVAGQHPPSRQQIAGVKLPVRRDCVALLKLPSPLVDVAEQVVPPLGVDAQGGSDVAAGSFGLVDVVQTHDVHPPSRVRSREAGWRAWTASHRPPGASQARPSGPSRSSRPLWETSSGTSTPDRSISSIDSRRK